ADERHDAPRERRIEVRARITRPRGGGEPEDVRDGNAGSLPTDVEGGHGDDVVPPRQCDADVEATAAQVPDGELPCAGADADHLRAAGGGACDSAEGPLVRRGGRQDGRGDVRYGGGRQGNSFSNRSASSNGPISASRSFSSEISSCATRWTSSAVTAS